MTRPILALAILILCVAPKVCAQESVEVVFVRPFGIKVCKVNFSINGQELFGLYNEQQTRLRLKPGRYTIKTDGSFFTCAAGDRIERPLVIPANEKEITFAYLGNTYPTQISQIRRISGPMAERWRSTFESVAFASDNLDTLVPAAHNLPEPLAPNHARVTFRSASDTNADAKVIRFGNPQDCSAPEAPRATWHDDPLSIDLPAGRHAFEIQSRIHEVIGSMCRTPLGISVAGGKHYVLQYGWRGIDPGRGTFVCSIRFTETDEKGTSLPEESAKTYALEVAPFTGKCTWLGE